MSSPASRRSQRNSVSATPQRSARSSQQAPSPVRSAQQNGLQATPRASRQHNIVASSPLIHQSSPLNGAQPSAGAAEANGATRINISSPLRQASVADNTPRGRVQAPGGMESQNLSAFCPMLHRLIPHKNRRRSTTPLALALHASLTVIQIMSPTSQPAAVGFSYVLRDRQLLAPLATTSLRGATFIPMSLARRRTDEDACSLTRTAFLHETNSQAQMPGRSRTSIPTLLKLMPLEVPDGGLYGEPTYASRMQCPRSRTSFSATRRSTGCG